MLLIHELETKRQGAKKNLRSMYASRKETDNCSFNSFKNDNYSFNSFKFQNSTGQYSCEINTATTMNNSDINIHHNFKQGYLYSTQL